MELDFNEVTTFTQQLRDAPRETRREVANAIRKEAKPLLRDMQSRASWSSRIPGALQMRVSGSGKKAGSVRITVDHRQAPHARPYEGVQQRGSGMFRHPVFGRDWWVSEPTRPFFMPAVRAHGPRIRGAIEDAVIKALPSR